MMESRHKKSLPVQIQSLKETDKDLLLLKLKHRLAFESSKVENPFNFIAGLLNEGLLCDGSSDMETCFGLKEIMVQLAVTIACSKGADAIDGLMKALEGSGNVKLISIIHAWAKEEFDIETDADPSDPKESASAVQSSAIKKLLKNVNAPIESSSSGTKLIDNITSWLEDNFMEQLQGHLLGKASEILNAPDFCTLLHQNVLEETDIQPATESEVQAVQLTEKAIKAACSKKAIGSLVVALENSNNEQVLVQTYEWLQTSQARKKNYPIAVKSLANQPRPTKTKLFVATDRGLIALDLQSLEVTALTSKYAVSVAVNHKLKKVYWTEDACDSSILRSNFDGSAQEVIVPPIGGWILGLAIDEASGNLYFTQHSSCEIKVCNELGQNCTTVISNSPLVNYPGSIAVDSDNGLMYWNNRRSSSHSVVRANLDGSNATTILTGWNYLEGFTLKQPSNDVLYWADNGENTIGTIDVRGGGRRTILKLPVPNPRPYGIQVDDDKIYFSNSNSKNIQSVDRDSGKQLTTIFNSTAEVKHLVLFNDS